MTATALVLRSRWRRHPGNQVALALVIAIGGAVVMATIAGAQRTETAYDRFTEAYRQPDVLVNIGGGVDAVTPAQFAAVAALPQVRGVAQVRAMAMQAAGTKIYLQFVAAIGGEYGRDIAVTRYVQGRAPHAADEVSLTDQRAELLDLQLGDTLTMDTFTQAQVDKYTSTGDNSLFEHPDGPRIDLRLVGIERTPTSVFTNRNIAAITVLPATFLPRYGDQVGTWGGFLAVDLVGGTAAVDDFTKAFSSTGIVDAHFESTVSNGSPSNTLAFVAQGLRLLAAISALSATVAVGLLMIRCMASDRAEWAVLAGLGVDRTSRRRMLMLTAAPGSVIGLATAAGGAVLMSSLFPFGLGGRAEPNPGIELNGRVIGVGTVVIGTGVVVLALISARWSDRNRDRSREPRRASLIVARLARADVPVPAVTGTRFVFERGVKGDAVTARSAIGGVSLGVMGLVAVLTFTSSQSQLDHNPVAWGRTWDVTSSPEAADQLLNASDITARSRVQVVTLQINGRPTEARGFEALVGQSMIPVSRGRRPGPGEIALGAATMADLGVDIGDTVTLSGSLGHETVNVVGQGMFSGISSVPVLNQGASMEMATLVRVSAPTQDNGYGTDVFRLEAGVLDNELLSKLAAANGSGLSAQEVANIAKGDRPDEFARLDEVRQLPWFLALYLGLLAVMATASLLIGAVRRRRHDIAILRATGLDRAGVRGIVLTQSFIVSLLGLLVGIPCGAVIGRLVWRAVAQGLGVAVETSVPVLAVAVLACAVIVVDTLVSLIPAYRAARAPTARTLRVE